MKKTVATLLIASIATFSGAAVYAADATDSMTAPTTAISKDDAKKLNNASKANQDARGKVAEANESLNKADCENNLTGSAARACKSSAKAEAKSEKADAKMIRKTEKQAIDDAAKTK